MRRISLLFTFCLWACAASAEWTQESGDVDAIASDAGNTIKDEYARNDVTPRMSFQCAPGSGVTARIDWGRFISSFSTEVGFKVDDGKFMWLKWKVDGSEKVTLSPSADDTARLTAAMREGNTLTVDVSPYSEGPVVVTFDLTGFADALATLESGC